MALFHTLGAAKAELEGRTAEHDAASPSKSVASAHGYQIWLQDLYALCIDT